MRDMIDLYSLMHGHRKEMSQNDSQLLFSSMDDSVSHSEYKRI